MENDYFSFNPGTFTCRTPIPSRFDHLLKFITKEENFLGLHSQEDITNINQQLDQTLNLMVSNIIQRVIAQVIGQTATGFVTIQGTDEGALHVSIQDGPFSSKTGLRAKIDFATAATHDIIAAAADVKHKITSIVFTVAGETNITLKDEDGNITGPMDFGGASEPRGIVINHGLITLDCGLNKAFQIINSAAVQVSGYVLYYDEA